MYVQYKVLSGILVKTYCSYSQYLNGIVLYVQFAMNFVIVQIQM